MRIPHPTLRLDLASFAAIGAGLMIALAGPAAAQSPAASSVPGASTDPKEIVVTTSVLGSVVRDLVGDRATVTVLMANGVDPHDWSPSAQEIESVYRADLVVSNGLDLEEGLHDALAAAEADGVRMFRATDQLPPRVVKAGEITDDGPLDPHFWLDPVAMHTVVDALTPVLGEVGVDVADRAADLDARLDALDAEVQATLASIPPERRKLVTGHESMGWFADRYGFELVGAVVPGLSSQGEVSARELAELAARIQAAGVTVIFAELGTPQAVTEAIASATGARVVALPSHTLPEDGSYETFIRTIATDIAGALS